MPTQTWDDSGVPDWGSRSSTLCGKADPRASGGSSLACYSQASNGLPAINIALGVIRDS